ncbi:hypothetical protein IWQ61_004278 [Dispira simplex]|nr:hypothetical protein IWQ61_004278 [Dispira simplex]
MPISSGFHRLLRWALKLVSILFLGCCGLGGGSTLQEPTINGEKIRGVNLGGWLVLEKWITPSVFNNVDAEDQWTFCQNLGESEARRRLEQHWSTWVTENDIITLKNSGINLVRIPLGHWEFSKKQGEPYLPGGLHYADKAVRWAKTHGLKVLIDIHTAPDSQNGFDNSGKQGSPQWLNVEGNFEFSLEVVRQATQHFTQYEFKDTVIALQPINEPASWAFDINRIIDFYHQSYQAIRQYSSTIWVVFHDAFVDLYQWPDKVRPGWKRIILDTHIYHCFVDEFLQASPNEHVASIRRDGDRVAYISQTIPVLTGEWSIDTTQCYNGYCRSNTMGPDDWDKPNAKDPNCNCATEHNLAGFTPTYHAFLGAIGDVQMQAYERGAGWVYWNFKTESNPVWNFMLGIEKGWLPKR